MSENQVPQEFWDRIDQIITKANEQNANANISEVSASLLYAAARYCAFTVASSVASAEEISKDREKAITYFKGQFEEMLKENMDDYTENYENYAKKE